MCNALALPLLHPMFATIHHIIINVNDFDRSKQFYEWLMPQLGYTAQTHTYEKSLGWFSYSGGTFWIQQAADQFKGEQFNKGRVGLCEVAFAAESVAQVDALAKELESHGAKIIEPPKEYPYVPGYYAVFFTDPDGMKLEFAYVPS